MKATDIVWDVDWEELEENYTPEEIEEMLPSEIEIPDCIDEDDHEAIEDYLSDVTGFCHESFVLED